MAKRVYFAFHYQDVIDFRANVVRKHNFTKDIESAGYYDASIWEEAKKTNSTAIKKMINSELSGTTVTAVLIGAETYVRPWVRYEIFKSLEKGNKLLGIHINGIKGRDEKTKPVGPDPFNHLGVYISDDGKKASPIIWITDKWHYYNEVEPWSIQEQPVAKRSKCFPLSHWCSTYDWNTNKGYDNFPRWIN